MGRISFAFCIALVTGLTLLAGCGGHPGEREFRDGLRELERGKYVRAKALLEKSINRRPGSMENAVAYNAMGVASWKLGQIPKAIEEFQYSARLDPKLSEPLYNLGVLNYESGDSAQAQAFFDQASLACATDPRPLEFLARIHMENGKWPEARRVLFAALARAPQSPRVLTALAVVESRGGGSEGLFYLMQALEKNSEYLPALFNLGLLYQQRDPEQSAAYYRKFLDEGGDGAEGKHASAFLKQREVKSAAQLKSVKPAVASASRTEAQARPSHVAASAAETPVSSPPAVARQSAPEQPVSPAKPGIEEEIAGMLKEASSAAGKGSIQNALNLCLQAAGAAEREKRGDLQEKALREGVRLCFDQPRAHYALGRLLAEKGSHAAAANAFRQAIVLDRKFVLAYLALAESATVTQEHDAALVALRQAVQMEPNNPDALWLLASLYDTHLGMHDKAMQSYRDFESRFPGDPRVVRTRDRLKQLEQARSQPSPEPRPVQQPPRRPAEPDVPVAAGAQNPPAVAKRDETQASQQAVLPIRKTVVRNVQAAVQAYNRGTLYQQQEDWDRAIFFYIRAIENDDSFATAYFNLGSAYWAKRDYNLAKEAYLRAIEIQPDAVASRYNLALIHRELGERSAAIGQLNLLLRSQPENAQAHYVLGIIYSEDRAGLEQARQHYRRFLSLAAPNDPTVASVRRWLESN